MCDDSCYTSQNWPVRCNFPNQNLAFGNAINVVSERNSWAQLLNYDTPILTSVCKLKTLQNS